MTEMLAADECTQTVSAWKPYWLQAFEEGWRVFIHNPVGRIGIGLLAVFGLMAVGSFIPPLIDPMYHPMTGVDPQITYATGPGWRHWLGTDFIGRDLFSQLLAGARIAFMVGISSALISIILGTALGMAAGYGGNSAMGSTYFL